MKHLAIFLASSLIPVACFSQTPEKIYGNARQHKPLTYYEEQAGAWKKVIDKNPKDATAWYNYYYANRNMMFNDTVKGTARTETVKAIVAEMEKKVPESYEYNLCRWQMSGFDPKALPYLKKAAQLGEGRTEHLDFMINLGEMERNIKDRDTYSLKKFEAGLFSSGVIYYNYNVLVGLEKNAILITTGDNDTYPVWLLQARGFRKDVTVINLSLLQLDYYGNKLLAELGIDAWSRSAAGEMTEADHERYREGIIRHIAANKKNYPVYVALTAACDKRFTHTVESELYLTGLAYKYSRVSLDNMALLKNNVEHGFAFDYLDKAFYQELSPDIVRIINGNYIVPLLTLYDHYRLAGETAKSEWVKAKLVLISKGTEHENEVSRHLSKS